MRRTLLMIAAVALLLTQCRKPAVELPTAGPANENMVSMTVTVGHGGKTDINGTTGAIKWSKNDKLYVGDGSKYIGCLTLVGDGGSPTGTFTGSVSTTSSNTFGFYYLGSRDYTTGPSKLTPGTSETATVSFASQTGLIGDLSTCHIGYGTATGEVKDGNVILNSTDPVTMTSKVAIAYFEFKENGTKDYTGAITLSGANICNEMTVKFGGDEDGKFTGKEGTEGQFISLTSTSSSKKYVMLVPPENVVEETLNFGGGATGSTKFYKGIEANKFYCLGAGEPIEVAVKPVEFTVGMDGTTPRTVKFAPGNLYYDGTEGKWKFEANQWDFRTYNDGTKEGGSCIGGVYSASSGTPSGDWGLFGWSGSSQTHYGKSTSTTNSDYSGEKLKDWGDITDLPPAGEGKTWHTLSYDEWSYLIGESDSGRDASLCEWSAVTFGESGPTVSGLIIMPDGYDFSTTPLTDGDGTTNYERWQALEVSGAVFLPAAGSRFGTDVGRVGSRGYYWSSTPGRSGYAYCMRFTSDRANTDNSSRELGYSVRLVW